MNVINKAAAIRSLLISVRLPHSGSLLAGLVDVARVLINALLGGAGEIFETPPPMREAAPSNDEKSG
jgi:hypothetical protein